MRHANIRGIDVPVHIEVANIAVTLFANVIRKPSDGQQIRRAIQQDTVSRGQTLTGQNFIGDWTQAGVSDLNSLVREVGHIC